MRIKKLSFKNVMYNALSQSYKREIDNRFKNCNNDFAKIFYWGGYRFTFWAYDLPIEIANY